MDPIGRAIPTTCPACGVGAVSGLCTLTRADPTPVPESLGPVETLACDCCGLWIRNGVVVERGVEVGPDDVRASARLYAAAADPDELWISPDARPLRLVPTETGARGAVNPTWPAISSITIHLVRPHGPGRAAR